MQVWFSDLLMVAVRDWVTNPFEINAAKVDTALQETLTEMRSDEIFQTRFKDGQHNVWETTDTAKNNPLLWDKAQLYVISFAASYLVESGFKTRGHQFKLEVPYCRTERRYFFSVRIIKLWNKLPIDVVSSPNVNISKHRYDGHIAKSRAGTHMSN